MTRLALAALLASLAAAAQDGPPLELRAETAFDSLDRGLADWREEMVQLAWRPGRDFTLLGGARATERFGQKDVEGFAGAYLPLGGTGATLHLEGTASGTHRVLARRAALAEISRPLGDGWVATAGAKAARFTAADARTVVATLEKYSGDLRYAYTLYLSRPDGGSWSPVHRLSGSWYRGRLTYATLGAWRGREAENVFPLGLLTSEVRGASLGAGIEVMPRWGLTFEWAWLRQGDLYTRRTARLGTRLLF